MAKGTLRDRIDLNIGDLNNYLIMANKRVICNTNLTYIDY